MKRNLKGSGQSSKPTKIAWPFSAVELYTPQTAPQGMRRPTATFLAVAILVALSIGVGSGIMGSRASVARVESNESPALATALAESNSLIASPQYAYAVQVAANSSALPSGYVLAGETPSCDSLKGCEIQVIFSNPQNAYEIAFILSASEQILSVVGPYPVSNFGYGTGAP